MSCELVLVAGRPCDSPGCAESANPQLSCRPQLPLFDQQEALMRRVVRIGIHRTFGEVVYWEDGRVRHGGRVDMTRTALEGFGKTLTSTDEVVIEATETAWLCLAYFRHSCDGSL